MGDLNRNGHRERMRNLYLSGGMENAPDHNLLELFLSLVIPQKDVKPLAYELINTFGSLENVIYADPNELMKVKGVKQTTATALSLIKDINRRIVKNRNAGVTSITSSAAAVNYCVNILKEEPVEKFVLISLKNDGTIIHHHILESGDVNALKVDVREVMEYVLRDNAAGVIIAHNHPNGSSHPSAADISFTIEFRSLVRKLNINFIDHIIVGTDECTSFSQNPQLFYIE